jgi:hypothetical protein
LGDRAALVIDIRLVLDDDHQVQVVRLALRDGRRALADSISALYKEPEMDIAKHARFKAGRDALDVLLARFDDAVAEATREAREHAKHKDGSHFWSCGLCNDDGVE